ADLFVERVGQLAGSRRTAAQVVEAVIGRPSIQPRAARRVPTKALQLPVCRQEDLLEQVLRISRVSEHPAGDAEQPAGVGAVELLKCAEISPAAPLYERHLLVAHGVSATSRREMLCHLRRNHTRSTLPASTPQSSA